MPRERFFACCIWCLAFAGISLSIGILVARTNMFIPQPQPPNQTIPNSYVYWHQDDPWSPTRTYNRCVNRAIDRYNLAKLNCANDTQCLQTAQNDYYQEMTVCADATPCEACFSILGKCKEVCICRRMQVSQCVHDCVGCLNADPSKRNCCACVLPWSNFCKE